MSNAEQIGSASKEAMDNAMRSFSAMTRGFQQIATETTEYTKRSYEQSARMLEQLSQSRTFDRVVEVQNEYAKSAYEGWLSQAAKMNEIYTGIAKEVYRPIEDTAARASGYVQTAMQEAA